MKRLSRTTPLPDPADESVFRVFLDEGVPLSVATTFEGFNYEAILHQKALAPGSTDLIVARAAILNKAVLIAIDKDMKKLTGRYGEADPKFSKLNVIKIACSEPLAAARIQQSIDLIDLEWRFRCAKPARRLYIEIGPHWIRTYR